MFSFQTIKGRRKKSETWKNGEKNLRTKSADIRILNKELKNQIYANIVYSFSGISL